MASGLGRIKSIELIDVSVEFPGNVKALRQVSLMLGPGVHVILGPNGAGKTTMLDVLAGMRRPTAGRVIVNEIIDLYGLSRKDRATLRRNNVAYLLQEDIFFPWLTVWENLVAPLQLAGTPVSVEAVREEVDRLGIASLLGRTPDQLSGGEARRASLARTLAKARTSSLILLDEPTSHLDRRGAEIVAGLIEELGRQGKIVVVATHDPYLAEQARTRVYLRGGVLEKVETI